MPPAVWSEVTDGPDLPGDRVLPIEDGTYDKLSTLKTTSGTVSHLNPKYGQPTAY